MQPISRCNEPAIGRPGRRIHPKPKPRHQARFLGTRSIFPTLLLVALAAAGLSCRKTQSPSPAPAAVLQSNVVANVAGAEISLDALQAELRRQFRVMPEGGLTAEQKLATLDRLVRTEAIYAQARARGFDRSAEMEARIKSLVVARFREQHFAPTNVLVSDEEILAAYEADKRFDQPAAVRGAVIFIKAPRATTPEKRTELRQRAEAVLAEAQAAADDTAFAQVVARHSEDAATRYRGGATGWMTRSEGGEAAVVEALLAVSPTGAFAPVIETPHGFYIARLSGRRDAGRKPLAEVREAVRYQLSRKKTEQAEQEFHAAMKAGLEIAVNRELVEAISLPTPKHEPPQLPGPTTVQARTEP